MFAFGINFFVVLVVLSSSTHAATTDATTTTVTTTPFACSGQNECNALTDSNCNPRNGCESLCNNSKVCVVPFVPCYCRDGTARDDSGICIPKQYCPRSCGDFECSIGSRKCGCERFCRRTLRCLVSRNGCHCRPGFARNSQNECIPQSQCPGCGSSTTAGPTTSRTPVPLTSTTAAE